MTHTESYELNQWSKTDRLMMTDFNADNRKIDAALKAAADAVSTKAEASALTAVSDAVSKKAEASALAALTATVNKKADASTVSSLADSVATKAEASELTALTATVNKKADASTVTTLTGTVNKKANASDLTALTNTVSKKAEASDLTALTTTVNKKADASTVSSLTSTVNKKANASDLTALAATVPKVVAGSYTGNGEESRVVSLGFTPKAIYINTQYGQAHSEAKTGYYYGGLALQGKPIAYNGKTSVEIVTNGVKVFYAPSNSASEAKVYTNTDGVEYYYVAFA